jgi:hypothetical protein
MGLRADLLKSRALAYVAVLILAVAMALVS